MNDAAENQDVLEDSPRVSIPEKKGILKILANHGHTANIIAVLGFIINLILAIFTYFLYEKTVEANGMSKIAIGESVNANKIAREANIESKRANSINDTLLRYTRESNKSSDSLNAKSMDLSKQSVSAQLDAMRQDKDQFLTLNRAFLAIDQVRVIDSIKAGKQINISYRITNPGTYPAELIESCNVVYIAPKRRHDLENQIYTRDVSGFVTKEVWMNASLKMTTPLTSFDVEILKNKENQIYFLFDGIYLDQLTNKKKRYSVTFRIDDPLSQGYIILDSKTTFVIPSH